MLERATVLFVEDMDLPRRGFCRYFGDTMRVIQAASVREAVSLGCSALGELDVVIADLGLPDGSGWEVISTLHACDRTLRFLVVSMLEDTAPPRGTSERLLRQILFVDKPTSGAELLSVAAYAYYLVWRERGSGDDLAASLHDGAREDAVALATAEDHRRPDHSELSYRQSQVTRGCMLGLTNDEIAEQLGITFGTVKTYVSAALRKLRISSRHEVKWAIGRDRRRGKCR